MKLIKSLQTLVNRFRDIFSGKGEVKERKKPVNKAYIGDLSEENRAPGASRRESRGEDSTF